MLQQERTAWLAMQPQRQTATERRLISVMRAAMLRLHQLGAVAMPALPLRHTCASWRATCMRWSGFWGRRMPRLPRHP